MQRNLLTAFAELPLPFDFAAMSAPKEIVFEVERPTSLVGLGECTEKRTLGKGLNLISLKFNRRQPAATLSAAGATTVTAVGSKANGKEASSGSCPSATLRASKKGPGHD